MKFKILLSNIILNNQLTDLEITMSKILVLGLPNAGKKSILRKTYDRIDLESEENPYKKEIIKIKTLQRLLKIQFQKEEADFLDTLSQKQKEDIFRDTQILIWVVDSADQRTLSTSLFYWKKILEEHGNFLKFAKKVLCFHKTDFLPPEGKKVLLNSLRSDFEADINGNQISVFNTSLNDNSIFEMMKYCLRMIHEASFVMKQIQNQVNQFLSTNDDFYGAAVLSSDGLPVIELGEAEHVEFVSLPANLWLGTNDRLKEAFNTKNLACTIHLDNQILIFLDIGSDLLLTTIAKSEAPLQFSFIRSDMLAKDLLEILINSE
jgi:predicted regulator of Ras-like GTPase activity (Roadblock/LC7/MglB family)